MTMTNINVRMESDLKQNIEAIFNNLGLTTTAAFNIFAKAVVRHNGIPFELVLEKPNNVTRSAIEETLQEKNLHGPFKSVEELMEDPVWSAMQSVLDGHIAVIPSKLDTWDMPGIAVVPGTFWMLHQMYPDKLSVQELQKEIDEYYTFMFGQNFDADYLGYVIE